MPPTGQLPTSLSVLRLVLHVTAAMLVTLRSVHLDATLHPFQRAMANEWMRLLFYVDVRTTRDDVAAIVTLPHFVLDIEEEIAANVDDEGFCASALPVGALFTIHETREHVHGVLRNYFQLADVALESYVVFGKEEAPSPWIPPPALTVRAEVGDKRVDEVYNITTTSKPDEWPAPLRLSADAAQQEQTRAFFDALDAMELQLVIGVKERKRTTQSTDDAERSGDKKSFQWIVVIRYDLLNQGHLEVTLRYHLVPVPMVRPDGRRKKEREQAMPRVFFDTSVALNGVTLVVVGLYQARLGTESCRQALEFGLKWMALERDAAPHRVRTVATDFWLWFILSVNVATVVCLGATWRHAYRLSLSDTLCFTFACCCALQWGSLVRYFHDHSRFHILGRTLRRGLPRVVQFLLGVFPIFVGFVLFGTVMFGAKVPRFQSASVTATTLFSVANGDEIHDTFHDVAYTPWIGQLYVYSYLILFSYVVLMVCIGIIEDAFFAAVCGQQDAVGHDHSEPRRTPTSVR
ncbi:hypothetical protein PsorP6_015716 [Peronosclerospora sorghi]|uniref:Uncharacterized protein n=1 Tax=Peronosclerospora sorghi TaxID=230839 RepID=A0ACC0WPR9_9STRA|nr:hypothetical protein PsorP6_015716 [Peronosclerospora sorghi]